MPLVSRAMEARELIGRPGVVKKIAGETGMNPSTITYWGRRNRIPAEHVLKVEEVTGVSRHELRPDIFPAPQPEAAE